MFAFLTRLERPRGAQILRLDQWTARAGSGSAERPALGDDWQRAVLRRSLGACEHQQAEGDEF